jgi:hypothetical protein
VTVAFLTLVALMMHSPRMGPGAQNEWRGLRIDQGLLAKA